MGDYFSLPLIMEKETPKHKCLLSRLREASEATDGPWLLPFREDETASAERGKKGGAWLQNLEGEKNISKKKNPWFRLRVFCP